MFLSVISPAVTAIKLSKFLVARFLYKLKLSMFKHFLAVAIIFGVVLTVWASGECKIFQSF